LGIMGMHNTLETFINNIMKIVKLKTLICFISIVLIPIPMFSFDTTLYQPNSLKNIIWSFNQQYYPFNGLTVASREIIPLIPNNNKFLIKVKYLGSVVPLSDDHKNAIEAYAQFINQPEIKTFYNYSIIVKEEESKFEIPIQDVLIDFLKKEIKKDDEFLLYVTFTGKWVADYLFIATEFQQILSP